MLIADFGLSKHETSRTSSSTVCGVLVYIDPKCFEVVDHHSTNSAKETKNWPFIYSEKPVEGTPNQYIQLYEKCWDHDPNQRPTIEKISETFVILKILDFSVNSIIKNELNGNSLGNQDESESITHPRDYTAIDLNEFGEIDTNSHHE
ncbi:hypothetical protein C2G38_2218863 [Gigaspora rosea]|uniref:Protein kinase domain-containing protein n=1 Tax=Gigaspora rosea TaxID=44941 RepID=A0A397U696_9GLOM|nr:hypothetical protein C2G38_2218863 [Gigaspora rosea]